MGSLSLFLSVSLVKHGFDIYFYVCDPNTSELTVHFTLEFVIFQLQIFFSLYSNEERSTEKQ